ncbi:amidohydrolase family protein [Bacillus sp. REN16]|uniref:amidohydrolase family protein n=1 Tax=Bacillus sp. REN16 TaxID=2887296 RepID=UPI001E3C49D8|nr:amidohydrolase family protein [Bacillus sp. REN16]MCC3359164.1 amidohydrolase family protein [Bacillus sp. REN16]
MVKNKEHYLLLKDGEILKKNNNEWHVVKEDVLIRNNRILQVKSKIDPNEDLLHGKVEIINCQGMVIFPGLHNCHSHLLEYWQRSVRDNLPLEPWVPFKSALDVAVNLTPKEVESIERLSALELLRNGVTTVLDHMFLRPALTGESIESAYNGLKTSGIRGILAPSIVDVSMQENYSLKSYQIPLEHREIFEKPPALTGNEQLQIVEESILMARKDGIERMQVIVGPGAPTFCKKDTFEKSVELAHRYQTLLHTHLLETRRQRIQSQTNFEGGIIAYLDRIGALHNNFIAAHVIWIESQEMRQLAERGVHIVHNPCSNSRTGSGLSPVLHLRDEGLNIGFGTDGGDSSDAYSISDQMKLAALIHRLSTPNPDYWISGEESFDMAVTNGARMLTNHETGNIEVGKLADLVVMRRDSRFQKPGMLARQLVHVGLGEITYVFVDGELVLDHGKPTQFDEGRDVEVLYNVIERGMKVYDDSMIQAEKLKPYLRSLYDEGVERINQFYTPPSQYPNTAKLKK